MQHAQAMVVEEVVNFSQYPLGDPEFTARCKSEIDDNGVLVLPSFLLPVAIKSIRAEGEANKHLAYYTTSKHNLYLSLSDPAFPIDHARNRQVSSSKGCITTDQIPSGSGLQVLYRDESFKAFLCNVLSEARLYEYADPLSSINLHFAEHGQELGWHFDNSSFAITLLIEKPEAGSRFEYMKDLRDADAKGTEREMNYEGVAAMLDGETQPQVLEMEPGALVLFRGRNSIHRVSPNESDKTRMHPTLVGRTHVRTA